MLLAYALACFGPETPTATAPKGEAPHAALAVWLHETDQLLPAYLSAPLPSPLPAPGDWPSNIRPYSVLQAQVCSGRKQALTELLTSHARSNPEGRDAAQVMGSARVAKYCDTPRFCASVGARYAQASAAPDRALLAALQVPCPNSEAILADPHVPDAVILAWYADHSRGDVPPSAGRLSQAIQATEDDWLVGGALYNYGHSDRPEIAAELLALSNTPLSAKRMESVMGALKDQSDPAAKAANAAWCADPSRAQLPACGPPWTPRPKAPNPAPTAGAERLVALGLAEPGLYSTDPFVLAGYGATFFDVETGTYPNGHHALMLELASAGDAKMQALHFLEIPPPMTGIEATGPDLTRFGRPTSGQYTLLAFGQGKQWSMSAHDLGDWYDLETTLAFLNGLALHIGSETKFVSLPTGDQTAVVLAGERGAVLTAIAEGLIQPTAGGESAAVGKAYEDAVFEQLNKETR